VLAMSPARHLTREIQMIEKIINQNTLTSNAFWLVNKALAYHFQSISAAVLLSDLIAKEAYFSEKVQLSTVFFD
jgi:hypothetical protein